MSFYVGKFYLLLGMLATAVSKYKKGEIVPTIAKITEFANAYGVRTLKIARVYNNIKINFDNMHFR